MKVLFICRGNVGRSQMAMAIFNKYSKHKSDSAGTKLSLKEGTTIKEIPLAKAVIECMEEENIDVSGNKIKQITSEMIENFDKIICMSEPEHIPDFLKNSPKLEYWEIEDPKGKPLEEHKKIMYKIKSRIKEFIKENNL